MTNIDDNVNDNDDNDRGDDDDDRDDYMITMLWPLYYLWWNEFITIDLKLTWCESDWFFYY